MLSSRERLRRCFLHEELDRPGVFVRTGYPKDDSTYDPLRALVEEKTDLRLTWPLTDLIADPEIHITEEPHSDDFKRHIRRMNTPEDAEAYLSLPMPEIGGDLDSFFQLDRGLGDRGVTVAGVGMNPAGFVAELFGSETFAVMSISDRDVVHALCERRMQVLLAAVGYALDHGVGPFFAVMGEEYVAPPLHGPKDFADFNVRHDKPILDRVHEAGGRVHVHCHGPLKSVPSGFLDMGADVLHPIEPPPMGDATAAEAKALLRGRTCIEGNIQIADMYEQSPDAIRRQTQDLIDAAFDDHRGLVVCPTASPYIHGGGGRCFDQFNAMIDTVLQVR